MIFKLHKPNKVHSNGEGYITRSGHTMFIQDIVTELNRSKQLEAEKTELKGDIRFLLDQINKAERDNGFWFSSNDLDKLRDIEQRRPHHEL